MCSPGVWHGSTVRGGKREELQRGEQLELSGTKDNKKNEEGVSEGQGLIIDPVRLKIEQSGEDWTWGEYKELNLCKKD